MSQEVDSTLIQLKNNVSLASNSTQKVEDLLKIGDYQTEKEIKRAEQHFLDALEIIDNNRLKNEQNLRAKVYVGLGVVSRRKGEYAEAIDYYLKAQKIYENQKDTTRVADIIHNMAMVSRYQKEYRKAIKGFKEAIKLKEQTKDTFSIAAGYNMLGVAYRLNKQLDSALISYKKAKELFTFLDSEDDIIGVDSNISVVYSFQKKYNKSLEIKAKVLKYHKRKGNKLSTVITYYNISNTYRMSKEYEKSLVYVDSSLVLAKEGGFKQNIMKAYRRKSYLNGQFLKNFEDAHNDYRMYKRYSDSIFNIENAKKIQALELNYEFEKERETLEFQKEQERREKTLYFILFFITLGSGIVVAYLVWKNAKNKLVRKQLEKELLDEKVKVSEAEIKALVADNTMRSVFRKELISQLDDEKKESSSKDVKMFIKLLTIKLQEQIKTEDKVSKIHKKIEAVNKGFDEKLVKLYPELSKNQRDFCVLLRLNLSIKEIASIKNVTIDSVKSMRYRIRTKLGLKSGEELEQFIQNL
jgi:tetratricopeptide (TPR) repeat protein/DNA-binding CsgD family transcriptional regulator